MPRVACNGWQGLVSVSRWRIDSYFPCSRLRLGLQADLLSCYRDIRFIVRERCFHGNVNAGNDDMRFDVQCDRVRVPVSPFVREPCVNFRKPKER